ncbi:MAG: hypothetical protein HY692_10320 [Cyanobacteria bacterium NC_groundwater_1444_Ag_S-0.65um_54_12]|nr:hypothetical protein [Cyanobacteria bacterium NC_groundwater_1444_Ag_S-0.65um_54_12]
MVAPVGLINFRVAGTTIETYAGTVTPPAGTLATNWAIGVQSSTTVDTYGNLFVSDAYRSVIYKISSMGFITKVAGNGIRGYSGDGGAATSAGLNYPTSVVVDGGGNLYIADSDNYRIRKIDTMGIITTVAGNGTYGYSGDGGLATGAQFWTPSGVAVDGAGNLYIVDNGKHCIRKVDTAGIITTVVGNGTPGYSGDGGPATSALLSTPGGVTMDSSGNLYIADYDNYRIRKIDTTGIITTVAGNGSLGYSGDGGPATSAQLYAPHNLTMDNGGNLYIAEFSNYRIRKVDTAGSITTVAGNGSQGYSGDGGPATSAQLDYPAGMAVDGAGNLYSADYHNCLIIKVDSTGIITTVAGIGTPGYTGDGGAATSAQLYNPVDVTVNGAGNLYITDFINHCVRKVDTAGIITTVAGNGSQGYSGDGGPATSAQLSYPHGMTVDGAGNLYIAEQGAHRVRKVDTAGIITTVAGTGTGGYSGDGGPAISAQFNISIDVTVDGAGNLYITDFANHRIRKVDNAGIITTEAGNGSQGYSGVGGPDTRAQLNYPASVSVDGAGNLYIADYDNHRIRKVDSTGIITTVAGNGTSDYSGDGGAAINAAIASPASVAVNAAGTLLYIAMADYVRRVR